MISSVEMRRDGSTLIVRIPMRFQRRGGRKRIVAPDGSEIALSSKPQPDGTLVKALARAWRWQRMLDEGIYTSVSEIGNAENISKSYVSRILRLALLAPDIVERNLVKVAHSLPLDLLAPLGCGLQTGAGTVMNSLAVEAGSSMVVLGTGSVGLAAVMAARIVGADPIIAVDIRPRRLDLARELGATHSIENRDVDLAAQIRGIANGGVDHLVETTSDAALCRLALDLLNPGGCLALLTGRGGPDNLPDGRKVLSVIQGDADPQVFIPCLIGLYQEGQFPFDRLVTFYDFGEINDAIAAAKRGETIKPVLRISVP